MQLILTQKDIETALTNYVNDLVNIKEGMAITVELKATRGPEGQTAVIEILPADEVAQAVAKPAATRQTARAAQTRTVEVKPTEVVKETAQVKPTEPVQVAEVETATEPDNSPGVTTGGHLDPGLGEDDQPDNEQEEQQEEEPPAVDKPPVNKATSLFASLNRPKNS
jgi:hypothetical protein